MQITTLWLSFMPPKTKFTDTSITEASARGDDSTLATNGTNPHYWYSVGDGHRLCLHIRKQYLSTSYVTAEGVIVRAGEENSSTRENTAGIFIADPYYYTSDNSSFTDYLTSDIDKITKQGAYSAIETRAWDRLPNKLIIPLLSGAHWRTVCAEIDYGERNGEVEGEHIHSWVREPSLKVILNDPYGGYNVSSTMANDIKESLIAATDRLLSKHYNDDSITITNTDDRVIVQKTVVDQQGRGSNGWDCGPITFSNIVDYTNTVIIAQDDTSLSTTILRIPTVDNHTHDAQVIETRAEHIAAYQTVAGERIDISMYDRTVALLSEEAEKIKQSYLTKSSASGLDKQISQLSPEDITHFFAILGSMSQPTNSTETDLEITEAHKQEAFSLVLEKDKRLFKSATDASFIQNDKYKEASIGNNKKESGKRTLDLNKESISTLLDILENEYLLKKREEKHNTESIELKKIFEHQVDPLLLESVKPEVCIVAQGYNEYKYQISLAGDQQGNSGFVKRINTFLEGSISVIDDNGSLLLDPTKVPEIEDTQSLRLARYANNQEALILSEKDKFEIVKSLILALKPSNLRELRLIKALLASRTDDLDTPDKHDKLNIEYNDVAKSIVLDKGVSNKKNLLIKAIESGMSRDVELLTILLDAGMSANGKYREGESDKPPLKILCEKLRETKVAKIDPDLKVSESNLELMAEELIDHGAGLEPLGDLRREEKIAKMLINISVKISRNNARREAEGERIKIEEALLQQKLEIKKLEKFIQKIEQIPEKWWSTFEKEKINIDKIKYCAAEMVYISTKESGRASDIDLYTKYESMYDTFCKFFQSQLRITLTGITTAASNMVQNKSASVLLGGVIKQIPYVGELAASGLDFFANKQTLISTSEKVKHFYSNHQEDVVIQDYATRVTEFCMFEILPRTNNGTPEVTDQATIDNVFKKEKGIYKVRVEPNLQKHWQAIAAKYVLKFVAYLKNNHLDYKVGESIGEKAADFVIPEWFRNEPRLIQNTTQKSQENSIEFFKGGIAYSLGNISNLSYAPKEQIEWYMHRRWEHKYEIMEIIEKDNLRSIVFGDSESLVISFRGTSNTSNWLKNLKIISSKFVVEDQISEISKALNIHTGFLRASESLWESKDGEKLLKDIILSHHKKYPEAKIYITGHSLGGAIASITALNIIKLIRENIQIKGVVQENKIKEENIYLYTFGQPKWCSGNSYEAVTGIFANINYYRIVRKEDAITQVPLSANGLGYLHIGKEIIIGDEGNSISLAMNMLKDSPRLLVTSVAEWVKDVISDPIKESHAIEQYVRIIQQLTTAKKPESSAEAMDCSLSVPDSTLETTSDETSDQELDKASESSTEEVDCNLSVSESSAETASDETSDEKKQSPQQWFDKASHGLKVAFEGDIENLQKLIDDKKVNAKNEFGMTILMAAACGGSKGAIDKLLASGANKDVRSDSGKTALHFASMYGHSELVRMLIKEGANKEAKDKDGYTPLHTAVECGCQGVVDVLLEFKVNIKARNKENMTPLDLTVPVISLQSILKNMASLLSNLAGLSPENSEEPTRPFLSDSDKAYVYPRMAEKLLRSGYQDLGRFYVDESGKFRHTTTFDRASEEDNVAIVKAFFNSGVKKIDQQDKEGMTWLHSAADAGYSEIVKFLLEKIDKDIRTNDGYTPLFFAAYSGHVKVVEILIKAGADQDIQAKNGITPLDIAARVKSHTEIVKILLLSKIHANKLNKKDESIFDSYKEKFDAKDAINLYFEIAKHKIKNGLIDAAKDALKSVITKSTDIDFTVAYYATVLGITDGRDDTNVIKLYDGISYYQKKAYSEALIASGASGMPIDKAIDDKTKQCFQVLQVLSLLKLGRFQEAITISELFERADTENNGFTNYLSISNYTKALSLHAKGKVVEAVKLLQNVIDKDPEFLEAQLFLAKLKYDAGNYSEARILLTQMESCVQLLPDSDKKHFFDLLSKAEVEEYLEKQSYKVVEYKTLVDNLYYATQEIVKHHYDDTQITIRFDIIGAQSKLQSLEKDIVKGPHTELLEHLIPLLDYGYKILDAENTIPPRGLTILTFREPHKRWFSVKYADKVLKPEHPIFNKINHLLNLITQIQDSLQIEGTHEYSSAIESNTTVSIKLLLQNIELYYKTYIKSVCESYKSEYFTDSTTGKIDEEKYIMHLAELAWQKQPLDLVDHIDGPIEALRYLYMEASDAVVHAESDRDTCIVKQTSQGYLLGGGNIAILRNKEHLYNKLTISKPEAANKYGKHSVVEHVSSTGVRIFYKYMPYAPGIQFTVGSLNKILLDDISLPTKLIKLEGRDGSTYGDIAYYLASTGIEGHNLEKVLADSKYMKRIDMQSFSGLLIASLLIGAGDAKLDQFIARFNTTKDLKGVEHLTNIKLISVDDDISFCSGNLGFKKVSGKGRIYSDVLNALFFFPQMDEPIDSTILAQFSKQEKGMPKKGVPERIMSEWLKSLYDQNVRYASLLESGFTGEDLENLKLPIKLPAGTAKTIYERLCRIEELVHTHKVVTHNTLFREFYPSTSYHYELKRSIDVRQSVNNLYAEISADETVRQDVLSHDRDKSQAAMKTISTLKMLSPQDFAKRFNKDITELAEEFIETIDFSKFKDDELVICRIITEQLDFVKYFRLHNINEKQLDCMFGWLFEKEDAGDSVVKARLEGLKIHLVVTAVHIEDADKYNLSRLNGSKILRTFVNHKVNISDDDDDIAVEEHFFITPAYPISKPELVTALDAETLECQQVIERNVRVHFAPDIEVSTKSVASYYKERREETYYKKDLKKEAVFATAASPTASPQLVSPASPTSNESISPIPSGVLRTEFEKLFVKLSEHNSEPGTAKAIARLIRKIESYISIAVTPEEKAAKEQELRKIFTKDTHTISTEQFETGQSLAENFVKMLLAYKILSPIAVNLIGQGIDLNIISEVNGDTLLHRLVDHPKVMQYCDVIEALVKHQPELVFHANKIGKLPGDIAKSNDKHVILVLLVNALPERYKLQLDKVKVLSNYEGEEEFIIKASKYLDATCEELKDKKYNHLKKDGAGFTILHLCAGDIENRDIAARLFIDAFESIRKSASGVTEDTLRDMLFTFTSSAKKESVWNIAKEAREKNIDILETLYEKYKGQGIDIIANLHDDKGGHIFAKDMAEPHKAQATYSLSKLYKALGWELSIREAIEGIETKKTNGGGNSILHELIKRDDIFYADHKLGSKMDSIKLVLKNIDDVNITARKDGWTPLHLAARMGQTEVMILLKGRGADINIRDNNGRTYEDVELKLPLEELASLINEQITKTEINKARTDEMYRQLKRYIEELEVSQLSEVKTVLGKITGLEQEQKEFLESKILHKKQIAELQQDPYKNALYETLCWELSGIYQASVAISTGMVENQKKGVLGKIGSLVTKGGDVVPMVGIGVKIIGEVLKFVDKCNQEEMIDRFAHITKDSTEMSDFVERLAINIIMNRVKPIEKEGSWKIKIGKTSKVGIGKVSDAAAEEGSNTLENLINVDVQTIISDAISGDDIQEAAASGVVKVLSYAKKLFNKHKSGKKVKDKTQTMQEEADKIAQVGEDDAKKFAKMIMKMIYRGELEDQKTISDKIEFITKKLLYDMQVMPRSIELANEVLNGIRLKLDPKDKKSQKLDYDWQHKRTKSKWSYDEKVEKEFISNLATSIAESYPYTVLSDETISKKLVCDLIEYIDSNKIITTIAREKYAHLGLKTLIDVKYNTQDDMDKLVVTVQTLSVRSVASSMMDTGGINSGVGSMALELLNPASNEVIEEPDPRQILGEIV